VDDPGPRQLSGWHAGAPPPDTCPEFADLGAIAALFLVRTAPGSYQ